MIKHEFKVNDDSESLLLIIYDTKTNQTIGRIEGTKDNNELYITIHVNQTYQKHGISKILFSKLFEIISQPEYVYLEKLVLDVLPVNSCDVDWLVNYYKEIGFRIVNKYPNSNEIPHMEYFINE